MSAVIPPSYLPEAGLLQNRRILITGAGDGLGRAAALEVARHGATVILLGRTVSKLEATYDDIQSVGGPEPAIYPMNLGGAAWPDYFDLAGTIEREFGRLDGILHCAAHFKAWTPLRDVEPKEWIESLQVNLTAAFALTRHCLPLLAESNDASIVFCSDRHGREAHAFDGAYGIAKAGLEQMAKIWAQELRTMPNLRVNSFDPGPMQTGMRLKGYPGEQISQVPPPSSVAAKLLWLLGPASQGHSGEAF